MIQYIASPGGNQPLRASTKMVPNSWVRVESPTGDEIDRIIKEFKLDEDIVTDALDPHEIPRLEPGRSCIYFITRLPDTDDDFNDFTTPITFIITKGHIITLSRDSSSRLWQPFIAKTTVNATETVKMLVAMFEAIVGEYQRKVLAINRQMRAASTNVTNLRPADIITFVEYERKLNDYIDALIPSNDALKSLLDGKHLKMTKDDYDVVEDITIDFEQIIARSKSLLRTITNVRDSYRAVMDTRLNETIRLLTVITLALTIPTMVAGLYGMNVELPGHEASPATFWVITALSVGTSIFTAFYFLRKRR